MKTFTFRLFGRTFTIRFGRKAAEEIKMEDKEYHVPHFVHPDKTFYACCIDYIESQRGKLADSTLRGYRNIIDNHLDAIMVGCEVNEITEELLQKAFNEEIAKGLSEKTLKGYRSFITKVITEYRPDLVLEIRVKSEEK